MLAIHSGVWHAADDATKTQL